MSKGSRSKFILHSIVKLACRLQRISPPLDTVNISPLPSETPIFSSGSSRLTICQHGALRCMLLRARCVVHCTRCNGAVYGAVQQSGRMLT